MSIRYSVLVAMCAFACSSRNGVIMGDDWGIAGYARLQGSVSHADGTAYGIVSLFFACGPTSPSGFGGEAKTDAQGRFDIAVTAPMAGTLPPSGNLICRVSSPGDAPPVAQSRATVPFSQSADTRPVTTFTLVEGQISP